MDYVYLLKQFTPPADGSSFQRMDDCPRMLFRQMIAPVDYGRNPPW